MGKSLSHPLNSKKWNSILLIAFSLSLVALIPNILANPIESGEKRYTDNGDNTITDNKTGFMWVKMDSYLHSGHWLNWFEIHDYVQKLNEEVFAKYNDWQLPTMEELKTLYEPEKLNSSQLGSEMKIHIDPIFGKNGTGSLWSANENGRYNAFGVVFNTGSTFNSNKKSKFRKGTRAVRNKSK